MSSDESGVWKSPPIEGRHYDAELFEELRNTRSIARGIGFSIAAVIVLALILIVPTEGASLAFLLYFLFALLPIGLGFSIWHYFYLKKYNQLLGNIEIAKMNDVKQIQYDITHTNSELREARMTLKNQETTLRKMENAQRTGDIVISGNRAPVIIDSKVISSFNTIIKDDPELASAIKLLGGYIEESGSHEAAEYYKELHSNIASNTGSKTTTKALWNGIVKALPEVEKLTNVTTKITTLFS